MATELSGGCLCQFIRFSAINPKRPHSCSCDLCQKHTGSQTVVWLEFTSADVQWTGIGGKPSLFRSSETSSRAFCPQCGSSLGAIDDDSGIGLLSGAFDPCQADIFTPAFHSFEDMKPEWWRKIFPDEIS